MRDLVGKSKKENIPVCPYTFNSKTEALSTNAFVEHLFSSLFEFKFAIGKCHSKKAQNLPTISGSSPTVGKNFSFCNSRSTAVPHSSSKPLQMKATMTYI